MGKLNSPTFKKFDVQEVLNMVLDVTLRVLKVLPYGWTGSAAVAISVDDQGRIRISTANDTIQKRLEYDASDFLIYKGTAAQGVTSATATWTIKKFTNSTSGNPTLIQTGTGSWDNRASVTYS